MISRLLHLLRLSSTRQILLAVFIALFVLTTYLMLIELPPKKMGWPHWDKVQHILVFLMLAGLAICLFFEQRWQWAAGMCIYGAWIEWMQATFTITRMATLGDWIADITGIAIAMLVTVMVKNLLSKNAVLLSANSV